MAFKVTSNYAITRDSTDETKNRILLIPIKGVESKRRFDRDNNINNKSNTRRDRETLQSLQYRNISELPVSNATKCP